MAQSQDRKRDGGQWVKVYHALLNRPAWVALGPSAKALFFDLRVLYNGNNNGNLSAALSIMKDRGWTSKSTLANALYELRSLGFIKVTRMGGWKQGHRVPSLFGFCDLPIAANADLHIEGSPAQHEYLNLKTLDEAHEAKRIGVTKLQEEGRQKQESRKKLPVQNSTSSSPKIEQCRVQKLDRGLLVRVQ